MMDVHAVPSMAMGLTWRECAERKRSVSLVALIWRLLGAPAFAGRGCTLKRAFRIVESVSLEAPTFAGIRPQPKVWKQEVYEY